MTHTVARIQAMGQDDQFQARCKPCEWGGDIRDSRAVALKDGLAHDAEEHGAFDGTGPVLESMPVVNVDDILGQFETNAPRLAPLYAAHMTACIDAGFSREEALVLTSDWARVVLWGAQL